VEKILFYGKRKHAAGGERWEKRKKKKKNIRNRNPGKRRKKRIYERRSNEYCYGKKTAATRETHAYSPDANIHMPVTYIYKLYCRVYAPTDLSPAEDLWRRCGDLYSTEAVLISSMAS
jgi:hypothetical protein